MAGYGIESGTAFGRGFDAAGLLGLLMAWIVKTFANHGPGWFIWDNQSTLPTNPYVVVCDQAAPTPNSKAKFIAFYLPTSNAGQIWVNYYMYWDNVTHTGVGFRHRGCLGTVDAGSFAYYFRGGPETLAIFTRDGANFWRTILTEFEGIWDGVDNLLEPETASGVTTNPLFLETDPGGYLSAYWNITGYKPLLDANGKLYFSIVLVTGSTYRIDIYKDAARTSPNLVGHTNNFTNSTTGQKFITADNASGLGGSFNTDITVAAATNIDCRFLRVDLQAGQAANFTPDNFYFLTDFQDLTQKCVYMKVENIVGDQLIVDFAGSAQVPAGAIISPYPHRWVYSSSHYGTTVASGFDNGTLPYHSNQGFEMQTANINSNDQRALSDWMQNTITRSNPNDKNRYGMMRPWVGELTQLNGQGTVNRMYGKYKNLYVTAPGGLSILQDQRVLNGVGYLAYFIQGGSYAFCIRNTESLS